MTNNISYNIVSLFIIIIIIMCLMNKDRKYKEYFNTESTENAEIRVLGTKIIPGFSDGIIDIGKIVYTDINI